MLDRRTKRTPATKRPRQKATSPLSRYSSARMGSNASAPMTASARLARVIGSAPYPSHEVPADDDVVVSPQHREWSYRATYDPSSAAYAAVRMLVFAVAALASAVAALLWEPGIAFFSA